MASNHSPLQGWKATVCRSITEVSAAEWDICVGIDEPLVRHSHLRALEQSGIAAPENGFSPCHIIMRDASGQLVAAAPAYLKTHSKGELGVDLGLAFAHGRAVGAYYRLCCTNPMRDSSCESSVIAWMDEQTEHPELQDPELARV